MFLAASSAFAASYRQIGGTIIDPILLNSGGVHPYTGANLQQRAILPGANLGNAVLVGATLSGADLHSAVLTKAVYDEFTLSPPGLDIYSGDWGLLHDATPGDLGMAPVPEPATGLMRAVGGLALAAVGSRR